VERGIYPERTAGFSLVEMIVVLAILGIVAAVTAPSLMTLLRQDDLTDSANAVAGVLRNARMAALVRAVPVSAVIQPGNQEYVVSVEADEATVVLGQGTMHLAPTVRLLSDRPRVQFSFDRLGSGNSDSVTLAGSGGTAVVGVTRWSGDVYVRK
jgi:general secretion pathway protein H